MKSTSARWVVLVRWAGRIVALVLGAFVILFIVGEGFVAGGGPPPLYVLVPWLVVLTGFGLGWKYEALGAALILTAFGYFNVKELQYSGRLLRWGAFHLLLIPAALFLLAWCGQRLSHRVAAPSAGG